MKVLMLFVDGLGLGPADPKTNPLATFEPAVLHCFEESEAGLPRDGACAPVEAGLGVAGRPQSATGQATLFTGRNAARLLGHHLPGFPNEALRELVSQHSIARRLLESGRSVSFANTYTDRYFLEPPRWKSVTTVMCETAGVRLWRVQEMQEHDSLFMDFTNRLLRERGHDVELQTPREAGRRLARHAARFDFCLYEYFLTDLVGHRGSLQEAAATLRGLDEMLAELLERVDLGEHSVVLTSDHGNIEDSTTRAHTQAPVPLLVWGPLSRRLPDGPLSLEDVTPWLLEALTGSAG